MGEAFGLGVYVDPDTIVGALIIISVFNVIPDYLSLLQTRWLLGRMAGKGRVAVLLAVDFSMTWTINASPMPSMSMDCRPEKCLSLSNT